jgi:hypothetical protein
MILGLNGLKGSGKDTVAAYLIKEYQFERRAFADPLKKSVAALFDIPFHLVDNFKNDPYMKVSLDSDKSPALHQKTLTFREFLQRYGTEAHRGVFGEDFWLDHTLPKDGFYSGRKIVITDCRFDNEAHRIHKCGGNVIEIRRPALNKSDTHESEQPLSPKLVDAILNNDKDLDHLYAATEAVLAYLGGGRAAEMMGGEVSQ